MVISAFKIGILYDLSIKQGEFATTPYLVGSRVGGIVTSIYDHEKRETDDKPENISRFWNTCHDICGKPQMPP